MLTLEQVIIAVGDFTLSADFAICKKEIIAIIGPSGAGKSTLLSCIAGFLPPRSGHIRMDDQVVTDWHVAKRPLSILFQDANLFPHMTASQNVGLGLRPSLRLTARESMDVRDALSRVGLAGMEDRKPKDLSGGQQTRVALARILLRKTPLLLLDEPFSALGPAMKVDMLDLVTALSSDLEQTVLMVTHDPMDALRIADRTIIVADGVATPPEDTRTLFDTPPESLRTYLGKQ